MKVDEPEPCRGDNVNQRKRLFGRRFYMALVGVWCGKHDGEGIEKNDNLPRPEAGVTTHR